MELTPSPFPQFHYVNKLRWQEGWNLAAGEILFVACDYVPGMDAFGTLILHTILEIRKIIPVKGGQ